MAVMPVILEEIAAWGAVTLHATPG